MCLLGFCTTFVAMRHRLAMLPRFWRQRLHHFSHTHKSCNTDQPIVQWPAGSQAAIGHSTKCFITAQPHPLTDKATNLCTATSQLATVEHAPALIDTSQNSLALTASAHHSSSRMIIHMMPHHPAGCNTKRDIHPGSQNRTANPAASIVHSPSSADGDDGFVVSQQDAW